jgi:hypothetical protein
MVCDGVAYTFHLVNLDGNGSVFLGGQRPWAYFEGVDDAAGAPLWVPGVGAEEEGGAPPPAGPFPTLPGAGWRRTGEAVTYHRNGYTRPKRRVAPPRWDGVTGEDVSEAPALSSAAAPGAAAEAAAFSHSWRLAFPAGATAAWLAYCAPYSYSDALWDVERWSARDAALSGGAVVPVRDGYAGGGGGAAAAPPPPPPPPPPLAAAGFTGAAAPSPLRLPPAGGGGGAILRVGTLCHSLAGNPLPLLTITAFSDGAAAVALRPYIVLSARVHPGESNGSWALRGAVDFLTSSAPAAAELRRRAVFKVVPMLNPDGVLNGNHRTGLAGVDLNRHWAAPRIDTAPTIWHLRALIMALQQRAAAVAAAAAATPPPPLEQSPALPLAAAPVLMFCDFHGHSRRRNGFTFGCHELVGEGEAPTPGALPADVLRGVGVAAPGAANVAGRLFPKLLAARAPTFAFSSCSWRVTRDKLSAARVAMWKDALLPAAYTLEAGFAGASTGPAAGVHYGVAAYQDLGAAFCLALLDWLEGPAGERAAAAVAALRADAAAAAAGGGGDAAPRAGAARGAPAGGRGRGGARGGGKRGPAIMIFS